MENLRIYEGVKKEDGITIYSYIFTPIIQITHGNINLIIDLELYGPNLDFIDSRSVNTDKMKRMIDEEFKRIYGYNFSNFELEVKTENNKANVICTLSNSIYIDANNRNDKDDQDRLEKLACDFYISLFGLIDAFALFTVENVASNYN